jgi:hypothetical protein
MTGSHTTTCSTSPSAFNQTVPMHMCVETFRADTAQAALPAEGDNCCPPGVALERGPLSFRCSLRRRNPSSLARCGKIKNWTTVWFSDPPWKMEFGVRHLERNSGEGQVEKTASVI